MNPQPNGLSKSADASEDREFTVRYSHSAGGVAYRRLPVGSDTVLQFALIATGREQQRWQLPKGRLDPGEDSLAAALREVEEETGLQTEYEAFLKTVKYEYLDTFARSVPEKVYKKVDFYLLRMTGGQLSDASIEVQGVDWATPEEALARLSFAGERDCVQIAMEYLHGR